jgi:hypothetical protein
MSGKRKADDISKSMTIEEAMAIFSTNFSPGRSMTREDWNNRIGTILIQEGLLPTDPTRQDAAIIALAELIRSNKIDPALFMKSIEQFKEMRSQKKGGRKQRGGADCTTGQKAIIVAMMAVLYWTGVVPTTIGYVAAGAASYMPTVDVISEKLTLCWSYLTNLVPGSFPAQELGYAITTVGNTFFKKLGETMILVAEAANLSLKMGVSTGALTVWNASIGWVKDNPTYVIAGIAANKAIAWKKDSSALAALEDGTAADKEEKAAQAAAKKEALKKACIDNLNKAIEILCDLIGSATAIIGSLINTPAKIAAAFGPIEGRIRAVREAVVQVQAQAAEIDPYEGDDESGHESDGGGKRSTRKRAGRTRKPKTRNAKKRKSSGRKAKKVSRKIKSRKGRKTRRRGSKKR